MLQRCSFKLGINIVNLQQIHTEKQEKVCENSKWNRDFNGRSSPKIHGLNHVRNYRKDSSHKGSESVIKLRNSLGKTTYIFSSN